MTTIKNYGLGLGIVRNDTVSWMCMPMTILISKNAAIIGMVLAVVVDTQFSF